MNELTIPGRRQEMKLGGAFCKKKWTLPPQNETKLNQTLLFYILLI